MKVTTTHEMRALDQAAIALGIPSLVLMERAALACVVALLHRFPQARTVNVLVGPGNNGGDGLAIARMLRDRGLTVRVVRVGSPSSAENEIQTRILRGLGVALPAFHSDLPLADVVVDALLGIGLSRPLTDDSLAAVHWVNRHPGILAVDVPSGLDSDTGIPLGDAVKAQITVALGNPKRGHLTDPAAEYVGQLEVADIGIPSGFDRQLTSQIIGPLHLPKRPTASHKGDFGRLCVVAGSDRMPGAGHWTCLGALQLGPGLVTTLGAPPLPDVVGVDQLRDREPNAVALGPGLGQDPWALERVQEALAWEGPLVLDADGLNALSTHPDWWCTRPHTVLTPHPAELGRLLGASAQAIQQDRWGYAEKAAEKFGCTVVLKGAFSLVAEPGRVWVNRTGSPALARGGSGDVLCGLIGALLAQGHSPFDAACGGTWLLGRAAELAADEWGEASATLERIIQAIPQVLKD